MQHDSENAQSSSETLKFKLSKLFLPNSTTPKPGVSDDSAQAVLKTLTASELQVLWKEFDRSRLKEGAQDEYKKNTSGPGQIEKRNRLLRGWLIDGKTCQGEHYKTLQKTIVVAKQEQYEGLWQPQVYMETKYGRKELLARVESGTIQVRKNPKDKRFYEFKDEVVGEKVYKTEQSQATAERKVETDSKDFLKFWALLSR